jgi:aryl-alcohol dehydrogenase-like predicted oxidoreductase
MLSPDCIEYPKICFGRTGMAQIEVSSKGLMQTTFTITGDFTVPRLGYGAMRLTGRPNNYGPYVDWEAGKQLLRHGVELGIRFIDTARAYGPGWNERLVADALAPYPDDLFIATKGGVVKKTATARFLDGSPEGLRRDCEDSLKNLRVDCINLYQLHWVDADVPLADSVAGLAALQKQGKIRRIGLCNVTLAQVEEALSITPIASVQNRYSVADRQSDAIVEFSAGQGILFIPYGPLGADPMKPGAPLASAGGQLAEVAERLHVSQSQVALAWLLHRSANIVVIPGTTSRAHLEENVASSRIELDAEALQRLDQLGPSQIA